MNTKIELIAIAVLFFSSMFFALVPQIITTFFQKYKIFESVACGIFFAAALLIFIPNMITQANQLHKENHKQLIVISFIIMGGTFLAFLFFEHVANNKHQSIRKNQNLYSKPANSKRNKQYSLIALRRHTSARSAKSELNYQMTKATLGLKTNHRGKQQQKTIFLFYLILIVHSYLAGFGISIFIQQNSIHIILLLMILGGIWIHKCTISFTLSVHFKKNMVALPKIILLMVIFSIMTPLGIISTHIFHSSSLVNWIITCIAGGVFLFLGTLHGLYNSVLIKRCCNLQYFLFVIFGFVITAIPSLMINK